MVGEGQNGVAGGRRLRSVVCWWWLLLLLTLTGEREIALEREVASEREGVQIPAAAGAKR